MNSKETVLVTGSTGFLGRRTVEMLINHGLAVRALVRTPSRIGNLSDLGAEIAQGDVSDPKSLEQAFQGIDYVIHAAADTSGTEEGARKVTIGGTRNILDLCASHQVKKLVYISSCSVYGPADYEEGQVIDENSPLERFPEQRGIYSWAKLEAEKLVLEAMEQGRIEAVCLRPGTIYGPGGENFSPTLGFSCKDKMFVVIDKKGFILPLVFVDNLVQAIIKTLSHERSTGNVFNVIDPYHIDKKNYINLFLRRIYPGAYFIYFPYSFLWYIVGLQEKIFTILNKKPIITKYRLASSQKNIVFASSKIQNYIDWNQQHSFEKAVKMIVNKI